MTQQEESGDVDGAALNVVATPDIASGAGGASASVLLSLCPSGKEVEVHTYNSAGAATDRPFYVLVHQLEGRGRASDRMSVPIWRPDAKSSRAG